MSEFFGRLETELRAAAERKPRRTAPAPAVMAVAMLALAVTPIVLVLGSGDPESPELRSPSQAPPRLEVPGVPDATVVASGAAPVAGPWELFTYRSERLADPESGEVYQPAGLRCLGVSLLDPPSGRPGPLGGQCGEFPRTPGFGRMQMTVPEAAGDAREILVFGRVPEEAALVRLTPYDWEPLEMKPLEGPPGEGDFYLFAVPADIGEGRVNWIDERGDEGSRGQELPPR